MNRYKSFYLYIGSVEMIFVFVKFFGILTIPSSEKFTKKNNLAMESLNIKSFFLICHLPFVNNG